MTPTPPTGNDTRAWLTGASLFYRHPHLYDELRADPDHTVARTCERLIADHGPSPAGTVIDFGCGTGRELDYLSTTYRVAGVDVLPAMVAQARRARPHLDIQVGDVRTCRLGHAADALLCLGNLLAYLHSDADVHQAFTTFATHAHPGALLIAFTLTAPIEHHEPVTTRVDAPGLHAEVTIGYDYDAGTRINTTRRHWTLDDGTEHHDTIRHRVLTAGELGDVATIAGFRPVHDADALPGYFIACYDAPERIPEAAPAPA